MQMAEKVMDCSDIRLIVHNGKFALIDVLLMIYNLPPWLCIKRKYIMLCMMIAGPTQLGNDIDVYLTLFIEDLTKLWE